MQIKTKILLKDYLKLQYTLSYTNPVILFSTALTAFVFMLTLVQMLEGSAVDDAIFWLVFLGAYIIMRPIAIYFRAKKSFNTNQILQEEVTYEFLPDRLIVISPYSNSEMPWSKIYKIRELRNWFLIYQSDKLFNLIPKQSLSSENIVQLKKMVKNIPGLKIKFRPE